MEITAKTGKTVVDNIEIEYYFNQKDGTVEKIAGTIKRDGTAIGYINASNSKGTLAITFNDGNALSYKEKKNVISTIFEDVEGTFK